MELDELKQQLKNKLATEQGRSDADLALLLNKRTVSVIDKLKRSLWIEIWFSIIILIGFSVIGLTSKYHIFRVYFSVFVVPFAGVIVILFFLLRKTSQLGNTALPVKSNLQRIVNIMEELMKRYFQFTMALIPICFAFSLFLVYADPKNATISQRFAKGFFSAAWQVYTFLLVYITIMVVVAYYATKYYLRKMYGKHVVQLKECIRDLSEE